MTALAKQYALFADQSDPRLLIETPGAGSNPSILAWAREPGQDHIYKADETAWCGLWMAYVALQAGWDVLLNPLAACNWLSFGTE